MSQPSERREIWESEILEGEWGKEWVKQRNVSKFCCVKRSIFNGLSLRTWWNRLKICHHQIGELLLCCSYAFSAQSLFLICREREKNASCRTKCVDHGYILSHKLFRDCRSVREVGANERRRKTVVPERKPCQFYWFWLNFQHIHFRNFRQLFFPSHHRLLRSTQCQHRIYFVHPTFWRSDALFAIFCSSILFYCFAYRKNSIC